MIGLVYAGRCALTSVNFGGMAPEDQSERLRSRSIIHAYDGVDEVRLAAKRASGGVYECLLR